MVPQTLISFVPVLFGLDRLRLLYQSAPRSTICRTEVRVSTLLMVVGIPNTPRAAGNGGRMRGLPRRPSIEFISAVSSPQMYAPAPRCTCTAIGIPDPMALGPSTPWAYASARACSSTAMGSVNSPRT